MSKPKLGSGKRFDQLVESLKKRDEAKSTTSMADVKDPGALAAWIGRKKFGKAKFQKLAAKGTS